MNSKLVFSISILLGCIILGSFYVVQVNKQRFIEKQQQISLQEKIEENQAKTRDDFSDYIYALNEIVGAKNIAMQDLKQTYDAIEKYGNAVKGGAVYSNVIISQYKEINTKYQLAKNKLDTIENLEMKNAIFDLIQALTLYLEVNEETIKFYQHLHRVYILNEKDDYQGGNKPNVNTAYSLLENSFVKMDKIILDSIGNFLDDQNKERYQNYKTIILSAN